MKTKNASLCVFYAISPIHAGSGASTGAVDLPIQRERHTQWPFIQASGVKGAFRDHFRRGFADDREKERGHDRLINFIFGSDAQDAWKSEDKDEDSSCPGAVAFSDARLLAFPVRSNKAPFVWVTSSALLRRLRTDLQYLGRTVADNIPEVEGYKAYGLGPQPATKGEALLLEESVVTIDGNHAIGFLKDSTAFTESDMHRLYLVSDAVFDYISGCCTEVQSHIKIDAETGTVTRGALWYQEFLPTDSVLYAVVSWGDARLERNNTRDKADMIRTCVQDTIKDFMQIGGDESTGKGICRVIWQDGGGQ